jgi:hypothetical protein
MEVQVKISAFAQHEAQHFIFIQEIGGERQFIIALEHHAIQTIQIGWYCRRGGFRFHHAFFAEVLEELGVSIASINFIDNKQSHYELEIHFRQGAHEWSKPINLVDGLALAIYGQYLLMMPDQLLSELYQDFQETSKTVRFVTPDQYAVEVAGQEAQKIPADKIKKN